jgi:threonine dehydratase
LSPDEAQRGVVAFSSGNHAQGVAAAGAMLGIHTAIVMPEDAPRAKLDNTRRREAIAREIAAERGAVVVPSYDHEFIIAGQGTVGLEIAQQCAELGIEPDQVLVNCGGGGLIAGTAVAMQATFAGVAVHPVEPEGFDDTARSLLSGEREHIDESARSICDALQAHSPGAMTFAINKRLLEKGLVVTDAEVRAAMRFAFANLKLVVEPGGAASLAAVLSGKIDTRDKTTIVVISGGNVDSELFAEIQRDASG